MDVNRLTGQSRTNEILFLDDTIALALIRLSVRTKKSSDTNDV